MRPPGKHRSVRLRLTALYGSLFLVSGAVLLALTYVLVRDATAGGFVTVTGTALTPTGARADRHFPRDRANQLLVQSGDRARDHDRVSAALGWLVAGRVLARQEAAFEAQRRFVANASHELRTPLAMMRTSLDVAVAKPAPIPPRFARSTPSCARASTRRTACSRASCLARAQHGMLDDHTSVSLTALVNAALRRARRCDRREGASTCGRRSRQ